MRNNIKEFREDLRLHFIPDLSFEIEKNVHILAGAKYYVFATEYHRELPSQANILLGDEVRPVRSVVFHTKIEVYKNDTDENVGNLRGWNDDTTLIIEEDISGKKQISLVSILENS